MKLVSYKKEERTDSSSSWTSIVLMDTEWFYLIFYDLLNTYFIINEAWPWTGEDFTVFVLILSWQWCQNYVIIIIIISYPEIGYLTRIQSKSNQGT